MSSVASMLMPGTKPLQSPEVSPSISLSVSAPGMSKEHMKQRYQRHGYAVCMRDGSGHVTLASSLTVIWRYSCLRLCICCLWLTESTSA